MRIPAGLRLQLPSPVVEIIDDRMADKGIRLLAKRDDLIHPDISGNKWRKLKYALAEAQAAGVGTLLTFGGAYSSHIRAVAAAGRHFGFDTIGVIRGEERPVNESLARAADLGMRLHYLDRSTYRRKGDPDVIQELRRRFGDFLLIPEGGSSSSAIRGCAELIDELTEPFDVICCAAGTGATLAGISAGLRPGQEAIGFAVLRGAGFLDEEISNLQCEALGKRLHNWHLDHQFHFGGFARSTTELEAFIADFDHRHGLLLDWVYVAKAVFGLFAMAENGAFEPGSTVVALITGGPVGPGPRTGRTATARSSQ